MTRPSAATVVIALVSGVTNVAVVLALYGRADHPTLGPSIGTGFLIVTGFTLGFVALLVSTHTRLLTPAGVFLTVLLATTYRELASPQPTWSELNGYVIVEGPTHIASYANAWYVWIALLLFAGSAEFGVRRGYRIGDHRLTNVPTLPLSGRALGWIVTVVAGLVGVATTLLVIRSGIRPSHAAVVVFLFSVAVAAIPLAALLARGMVLPIVLFAPVVPYFLAVEVFITTDSPLHLFLFGPYAILLAIVWTLESVLRSRLRGWSGGRFTCRDSVR